MHLVERWGLAAMALGAALLVVSPAFTDLSYDANTYAATGHGWERTHELVLAWGDVLTFGPAEEGHSHHFPPAYPLYLGLFFSAFGYGLAQAKAAAIVAGLAAVAVVYLTTRDLFGRVPGAIVGGAIALDPQLLWTDGMGMSESLALLFFTLTMWAILRSLTDERFIVLGGAFAGVAYLSRASMGAFFLIAGVAGLAWRLWQRGWKRTLLSPWYATGILVFALIIGAWAWRNVDLFGWPNWETSVGSRGIPTWVREHPRAFAQGLAAKAPLIALCVAPFVVALWPEARRSLAKWRDEPTSALWLATGLVLLLGLFFAASYYSMGPSREDALRFDNMRYGLVAIVPLAWALARESDWDDRATRRRWGFLGALLVVGCALVLAFPAQYLPAEAARSLDPHLQPGDTVVVAGAGKYPFYASITHPTTILVFVDGTVADARPEFIVSLYATQRDGYVTVLDATLHHPWWPIEDRVVVLARADVAAARGIVQLEAPRAGW